MNVLTRYSAKCLWTGAAVRLPRQPDGRVLTASSARFLCAAAGPAKDLGEMVKKDKVVVFMKGTPAQPLCGFSNAVVQILRMHGVDDYAAYNVLDDSELREGQWRRRDPHSPLNFALSLAGLGPKPPLIDTDMSSVALLLSAPRSSSPPREWSWSQSTITLSVWNLFVNYSARVEERGSVRVVTSAL